MGSSRVGLFIAGVLVLASAGVSVHFHSRYRAVQKERAADAERIRQLEGELVLVRAEVSEYKEKLSAAEQIASDLERERDAKERLAMARASRIEELEKQIETMRDPEPPDGPVVAVAGEASEPVVENSTELAAVEEETPLAEEAAGEADAAPAGSADATPVVEPAKPDEETDAVETAPEVSPGMATTAELERELEEARTEKAALERRHAELTGDGAGVPIGEVRVTTGLKLKGKVLVVNERYNFVVIDLGARDGVEKGMVLILHRGKKFVGKCQVAKVYNRMSAADLVLDWMKDETVVGDGVRKF